MERLELSLHMQYTGLNRTHLTPEQNKKGKGWLNLPSESEFANDDFFAVDWRNFEEVSFGMWSNADPGSLFSNEKRL